MRKTGKLPRTEREFFEFTIDRFMCDNCIRKIISYIEKKFPSKKGYIEYYYSVLLMKHVRPVVKVKFSKEGGKWYLTDGTEMINLSDLFGEECQITIEETIVEAIKNDTAIAKAIGDLIRTQRLTPKEEAILKRWEESGAL